MILLHQNHVFYSVLISYFSECGCDIVGSINEACSDKTGCCFCKKNFVGYKCDKCRRGTYGYPLCQGTLSLKLPTLKQKIMI